MNARANRPPQIDLLLHDEHVVAINKPPGVLSAPGRGTAPAAADLLRTQLDLGTNPALRIVHRLDSDASGVLLYARTLKAQQLLVRQFASHSVEKRYYALVSGYVPGGGEVDLPLTYDRRRNRVRVTHRHGRPSLTRYRLAQRVAGNTLLECELVTGRKHQLRAHMAAIGYPLTVDPVYGGGNAVMLSNFKPSYRPSKRRPERPLIDRLTLHAYSLAFDHPATGERVLLQAPLPKDLRATVNQLARLI